MIFDDSELVDRIEIQQEVFIANPSFNLYVFFHSNKAEFYEISSGILMFQKQILKSQNQKYFKLFDNKNNNCYVNIVLQVYDKLDAKIHTNYQTNFYNERIVYYPPYPQKYYTWPRITNGPNVQQQITLQNEQMQKIDLKFLSLSPLTITGISQFDQNNVIFSLINNNWGLNQYLVQTENLSAFIYVCQLNELEQKCQQKSTFYPLIKLVEDNIKWTEVGMYDSYIGIKTQNNHVITIYRVGDSKIIQIFQIKTSLQDEKTQITDFAINAYFVFVLISGMNEIQIYSLSLKQQIDTISNLENAQKVYISNTFNKNLLFIKCNNIIIIGHYVNEFNVISQIQVTDQQSVQLLLSIFRSTLVIVYKTVTEQGILQYLIHNLNSVTLLRRLPLYYYQLPQKLQLASNSLKNLILVTAYSVYTQTTVILVYQINEYQRNSLLTVIDTFDYFESELNYCVAGIDNTVIQFIYKGKVYSYLYFEQPRIYINQLTDPTHFQSTLMLQQQEWNDYYNLRREYNKEIIVVDMQLEMQWIKDNINLEFEECEKIQTIKINNNWIQGQRIQYKLSCILCTTDNDSGQIYLLNQFQKSNRQIQSKSIQELIKFDQNFVLILSELTGTKQYLQFINNFGEIINEIELQSEQNNYVATKLYLLTKQILVILYENPTAKKPELWYYYCWEQQERQDCKVKGKMEFQDRRIIKEMRYFNNVQIILTEGQIEYPSVYFYSLELDDKVFTIQQFDLIINKDYFHENFNVTSFDIMKLSQNEGCLILAEFEIGIITIKMILSKEKVSVQQYQYLQLPFSQQRLVEPQENRFIKVEIFKEGKNNCNMILVDQINESYQIYLKYERVDAQIQIIQVFQKLGNIIKLRSIGVLDHYLLQLYRYENKNYYCLYDIEENEDVRSNAGICKAGLKLSGQDMILSQNFVVRKNHLGKYQLLINTYDDRSLQLYTIDQAAKIVVKNSKELKNYTVNLIAVNPYKQVQLGINITLSSCPIADQDMKLFFILLIQFNMILRNQLDIIRCSCFGNTFGWDNHLCGNSYVYKQTSQEKTIIQGHLMICPQIYYYNSMTQLICVTIFSAFFALLGYASECESLIQEFTIIGTVNESFSWDMRKNFFRGSDLQFNVSLPGYPYVATYEPIQQMGFGTNHGDEDIGVILTLKPRVNQETRAWMNDFIFLEQNQTDVDIHYSLNDPMNTLQTPYFSDFITVHKSDALVCFDADFVTETTIIVDCTTALAGIANGFIFIDVKTGEKHIQNNDNPHNYNKTKARKIVTLNFTAKSSEFDGVAAPAQSYLFRGEPAWATENNTQDKLDTDCELEVFLIDIKSEADQKYVAMLNTTILKTLLHLIDEQLLKLFLLHFNITKIYKKIIMFYNITLPQPVDNFSLIDFQVEPNGELYVLDAFNGVYVLSMSNTNQFQLMQHFENPTKEQIYGFDFNYLGNPDGSFTQHLVLAFKNKIVVYENFNQKFTFSLPHPAVYGELKLSMSQEFLVIYQKQGTYLYHIQETMLLFKNEDYFEQILVNPYYPDMIGINQQRAYRYELSKGYLQMFSQKVPSTTQVQFNLNSWPQNGGKMCSILIKCTILPQNDTNIYRTSHDPFPDEIVYPSKSIVVDLLASGPSLMYKQLANNSNVELTLDSMWEVFVKGVDLPDAKDVVYADLLVLDQGDRVYFLFQTPDQNCTMIRCGNQDIKNTTLQKCLKIDEFHVPFILNKTKSSFTWWQTFNMVTYVYQETDYIIKVFTSSGQSSETDKIEVDSKITSFAYLQNAVFLVQSEKYQISVWTVRGSSKEIYQINQNVLRQQGYNGTFIPKAVFGNPKIRGQIIFIQTQEEVLIGEFANGNNIHVFHLMHIIPIIPKSQVSIAIGPLTFTIVQKTASEQIMEEYNWEHLQLISLNKNLPLYKYQLQEPLNIDYCSQSGWLFVRAIDTQLQETVILVYEPNVLSHVSLHKVIQTGYKINDVFDMAVDGNQQMFIYFNDNKVNKFITLLQDAVLTIEPKEDTLQYVNKLESSVQISSVLGGTPLVVNEKIKLMNTDSKIIVKQKVLDKYMYMFQYKKNEADQSLEIKSDWYEGQPYDLFVLCEQCGDQVLIEPQIVKSSTGSDMKYVIYDGTQFDSDTLVYQADKSLIFQHKNGSFLNRINLEASLGEGQRCELLTVTKDSKHIISTVIGIGDIYVLVNECTETKCKQYDQGEVSLAGVTQAIKMRFVFGRNFIVLNTDPVSYSKFESSIIVYSFNTSSNVFTILSQKVINTKYLGTTSKVQIADFCHLTVSESIYAILFTDITRGVWIVNLGSNVDGSVTELNKELINLRGFEHEQYYLKDDTHFHQLKILSQEQSDKIFKIQLLVTTSNVANYIFYFELDISSKTGVSYVKQSLKLQQVLFNYGDWKSVNKMSFAANHVCVAYTDGNEVVLAVYYIEVKKLDEVKTVPFIYGIRSDYNSPLPADFAMILSQYQNQTYLYANIEYDNQFSEHTTYRYTINDKPKLILKNCSTLKEQNLDIYAVNHFGASTGKAKLWDSDNVPDEDDTTSSKWWWITLIVIFGVAILGVGGFFLYSHYNFIFHYTKSLEKKELNLCQVDQFNKCQLLSQIKFINNII